MSSLANVSEKNNVEINTQELILRLKTLSKECNIEIVQLAITTMLEEIKDAISKQKANRWEKLCTKLE